MNADNSHDDATLREANAATLEEWRDFLDLPLTLTVELGRTQLTARELLDLEADSIVQLPRSTGEGVEVLAGNYRIACGEIILIEDRYGVRLNELTRSEKR
jgi:flagellar motor switch protein FliN/FliY